MGEPASGDVDEKNFCSNFFGRKFCPDFFSTTRRRLADDARLVLASTSTLTSGCSKGFLTYCLKLFHFVGWCLAGENFFVENFRFAFRCHLLFDGGGVMKRRGRVLDSGSSSSDVDKSDDGDDVSRLASEESLDALFEAKENAVVHLVDVGVYGNNDDAANDLNNVITSYRRSIGCTTSTQRRWTVDQCRFVRKFVSSARDYLLELHRLGTSEGFAGDFEKRLARARVEAMLILAVDLHPPTAALEIVVQSDPGRQRTYTVVFSVGSAVTCSCPDNRRPCKHIIFVWTKLVSPNFNERTFSDPLSELPVCPDFSATCLFCFDALYLGASVQCRQCHSTLIHEYCVRKWAAFGNHSCPFCRFMDENWYDRIRPWGLTRRTKEAMVGEMTRMFGVDLSNLPSHYTKSDVKCVVWQMISRKFSSIDFVHSIVQFASSKIDPLWLIEDMVFFHSEYVNPYGEITNRIEHCPGDMSLWYGGYRSESFEKCLVDLEEFVDLTRERVFWHGTSAVALEEITRVGLRSTPEYIHDFSRGIYAFDNHDYALEFARDRSKLFNGNMVLVALVVPVEYVERNMYLVESHLLSDIDERNLRVTLGRASALNGWSKFVKFCRSVQQRPSEMPESAIVCGYLHDCSTTSETNECKDPVVDPDVWQQYCFYDENICFRDNVKCIVFELFDVNGGAFATA